MAFRLSIWGFSAFLCPMIAVNGQDQCTNSAWVGHGDWGLRPLGNDIGVMPPGEVPRPAEVWTEVRKIENGWWGGDDEFQLGARGQMLRQGF